MNEIFLTVTGNVGSRPRAAVTKNGQSVASFRLGSTPRRFDRAHGGWVDGTTSWFTVNCWRQLADHVSSSVGLGDPVVVHGRLKVRQYTRGDGTQATSVELDATTLGHDLTRGTSMFERAESTRTEPSVLDADTTAEDLAKLVTEEAEAITAGAVEGEASGSASAAA